MTSSSVRRRLALSAIAAGVLSSFQHGAAADVTTTTGRPAPLVLQRAVFAGARVTSSVPASSRAIEIVSGAPNGVGLLRALGAGAVAALAPSTGLIGALVELPDGTRAEDLGLDPVAPGIGRLRARPERIDAFALSHPQLRLEVSPPLRPLMDRARGWVGADRARRESGLTGRNVFVGVADSGLDVTHHEMRDANGKSRVKWMLDLSLAPTGRHPELEKQFSVRDEGKLKGAVFSNADIDELLLAIDSGACVESITNLGLDRLPIKCAPTDESGHGTHVTGIAAGSGDLGPLPASPYGGVAPMADLLFVRITREAGGKMETDDFIRAVQFIFDRADAEGRPVVANFSLGSTFGPHDGTTLWEKTVASFVGPDKPGHAIVAAAGNSGSIAESEGKTHQTVRLSRGATMRVPITTFAERGAVKVWITLRQPGVRIGLESPEGVWIAPIGEGRQASKTSPGYDAYAARRRFEDETPHFHAGVVHGSSVKREGGNLIPTDSRGAIVVWTGQKWPAGTYYVTLEGAGSADLYLQEVDAPGGAFFTHGVREGTVNLPATHPAIISVGCTANRSTWRSIDGVEQSRTVPLLDDVGGLAPETWLARPLAEGEMCWFSSAGPTAAGVPKPEIAAPGALVVSAMSRNADPANGGEAFSSNCETPRCRQVDATHGVASGTSMSSPVVAGAVALLLERDPSLTQDKIVALLQAGAHRFRGAAPYDDQSGPGELDVMGSLAVLEQMRKPEWVLPSAPESWMTLSSGYVVADGSRPMTAILELRTVGRDAADLFDVGRLQARVLVDGELVTPAPAVTRRAPGLYLYEWTPPRGLGGKSATFAATFDGADIVTSKTLPIAADPWTAWYPSTATGSSCALAPPSTGREGANLLGAGALLLALRFVRRRRTTPDVVDSSRT